MAGSLRGALTSRTAGEEALALFSWTARSCGGGRLAPAAAAVSPSQHGHQTLSSLHHQHRPPVARMGWRPAGDFVDQLLRQFLGRSQVRRSEPSVGDSGITPTCGVAPAAPVAATATAFAFAVESLW